MTKRCFNFWWCAFQKPVNHPLISFIINSVIKLVSMDVFIKNILTHHLMLDCTLIAFTSSFDLRYTWKTSYRWFHDFFNGSKDIKRFIFIQHRLSLLSFFCMTFNLITKFLQKIWTYLYTSSLIILVHHSILICLMNYMIRSIA